MAFTKAWDETAPDGSVITVSLLDDAQRDHKVAVRERLEGDGADANTGIFQSGSFSAAPKIKELRGKTGTTSNVTYGHDGDSNTGVNIPGADQVDLVAGGVVIVDCSATAAAIAKQLILPVDTPANITGNEDDYVIADAVIIRLYTQAATDIDITGIAGGADGRIIAIQNLSASESFILKHEDASSSAANRFHITTGSDLTIGPDGGTSFPVILYYDGTISRWTPLTSA